MALDPSLKSSLMLDQWDHFSFGECEEIAHHLDNVLPALFRFHTIETCSFGDQKHLIAVFEWADRSLDSHQGFFALIPGGQTTLGYDREHPFIPSSQQQESWVNETQKNGIFPGTLHEFLDQVMTPLRQVRLDPFLLEVRATHLPRGWRTPGGRITFEETRKRLHWEELRLPTSDEWEYACSAGSRTLFRWGNITPALTIPHESQRIVEWDLHLRPNAFGLLIARDPNQWEMCAEPGLMRGGDGGSALHVGAGTFAEWLTLASAFSRRWDREVYNGAGAHLRRAFSVF